MPQWQHCDEIGSANITTANPASGKSAIWKCINAFSVAIFSEAVLIKTYFKENTRTFFHSFSSISIIRQIQQKKMAPKKSKGGRNGFFYFMMDYKDRQGKKFNTMVEVSEAAGRVWEKMGPAERAPYNGKATYMKNGSGGGGKFTALNENMDIVTKLETEQQQFTQKMNTDIQKSVKRAANTNVLGKEYIHIMHINNFVYCNPEQRHYPAEIALLRFNLEDGVLEENIYHEIIRPGSLPLGYSYKAKAMSEEYHRLPPPIGDVDSNLDEVMESIHEFMFCSGADEVPPIYVGDKDMKLVKEVIRQLCGDYDYDFTTFKIYSLQYLLFTLKNCIEEAPVWPTITQSILELEKDVFGYTEGIACDFHEQTDVPIYCSRSWVIRCAFIICDNCCHSMGINIKPGNHIPMKSDLLPVYDTPENASFYSCNNARGPPSVCGSTSTVYNEYSEYTSVASSFAGDDGGWSEPVSHKGSKAKSSSTPATSQEEKKSSNSVPLRRPNTVSAGALGVAGSNTTPFFGRGRAHLNPKF